jgi:hypothetical protein
MKVTLFVVVTNIKLYNSCVTEGMIQELQYIWGPYVAKEKRWRAITGCRIYKRDIQWTGHYEEMENKVSCLFGELYESNLDK